MRSLVLSLLLVPSSLFAQQWVDFMLDPSVNFYTVQQAFETEWNSRTYERGQGWKQFRRWEWLMEPRVYPTGQRFSPTQAFEERKDFERLFGNGDRSSNWQPLGPSAWQTISYNPGMGRVNVVTRDPSDANRIFAGTPSGGLWRSLDGGATWAPLTDEFSAMGISGIVIDHSDPNTIYVSTGDGDGADTYSIGVMKSTDGGQTWATTGMTHTIVQSIVSRKLIMHPTDEQILFVCTNDGLFKTVDAGANWTLVQSGSMRDVEFKPGDPSTVYTCSDEFFKSTDGGDTFNQVFGGLPTASSVNRISIAVSPDEPNWIYLLAGDQSDASFLGLYKSQDSGASFSLLTDTPNMFGYAEDGSTGGGQSWYDMALAANPSNADIVLLGGINVWRSTDGGNNFTISSHWVYPPTVGYTHADIHTLDYFGNDLFCGSDGGLFLSTDNGISYTDLSFGMEITQFYRFGGSPQNANLIIAGSQDNGSNFWDGTNWTHVMGADGMEGAINPTNANVIFCTFQFGGLRRTLDGGANWSDISTGSGENGSWVTPYESLPGNKLIIAYENVWLSNDNGDTFNPISNFSNGSANDLDVCKGNHNHIAVSFDEELYLTQDGGSTWNLISTGLPNNFISDIHFHPTDPELIYVTLSGFDAGEKVYVTRDAGTTWFNISNNLPNLPTNTVVFQEGSQGGIYVGMDVGIYYTDSTLSNWQLFDTGIPNVIVNELEIHYGSSKIRAATYGRGVWESDLFTPSTLPPEANFGSTEETLCSTDSVRFFDASLNAAPGWTWYFPGGSPSTSTLQNPSVLYPAAGTYSASLVVNNPNGSDSIAKTVTVNIGLSQLNVTVNTDDYPGETSWTITDQQGNTVHGGGGYGSANNLYQHILCVDTGCYDFTIYDSYGDGICCGFGNGSYNLQDDSGNDLADGGSFGSSETTPFCVGTNLNVPTQDIELNVYPNPASEIVYIKRSINTPAEYQIIDGSGRKVLAGSLEQGLSTIDVSELANGNYLLEIRTEGTASLHKIAIAH